MDELKKDGGMDELKKDGGMGELKKDGGIDAVKRDGGMDEEKAAAVMKKALDVAMETRDEFWKEWSKVGGNIKINLQIGEFLFEI